MSYAKFHDAYWEGEKIEPLSDQAALLGAFLISGKHRNAIGCFKLGVGAISDIPRFGKWGIEGVSKALLEMVETGFIARDDKTGWTLIVNYLNKDPIKGGKSAIHALKLFSEVPKNSPIFSRLKEIIEPQLRDEEMTLKNLPEWAILCPIEAPSKPHTMPMPSPTPVPKPIPLPIPNPTPEPIPPPSSEVANGHGNGHSDLGKKNGGTKPASRVSQKTRSRAEQIAHEKWEQNCMRWMSGNWESTRFEKATSAYLENPDDGHGKDEFELASRERLAAIAAGNWREEISPSPRRSAR